MHFLLGWFPSSNRYRQHHLLFVTHRKYVLCNTCFMRGKLLSYATIVFTCLLTTKHCIHLPTNDKTLYSRAY